MADRIHLLIGGFLTYGATAHGLPSDLVLWDFETPLDGAPLAVHCVATFDAMTKNGSLVHGFEVMTQHEAAALAPAMRKIAPPPVLDLFERAVRLIDPSGELPADEDEYQARVTAAFDPLQELSREYYAVDHLLVTAHHLYAIEHKAAIRAAVAGVQG